MSDEGGRFTCAWCGRSIGRSDNACENRRGENFCRPSHREARNKGLKQFFRNHPNPAVTDRRDT